MVKMTNYCFLIWEYSEKNLKYNDKASPKFDLLFYLKQAI